MHVQSTSFIDAGAEMESETDSTSIVTSFDASITGDELDSAVQFPNVRLIAA